MSRKLTPPEKSLWQIITRRITPLHPEKAAIPTLAAAEERAKLKERTLKSKRVRPGDTAALASAFKISPSDTGREVDRKTMQRLQRGQMDIEATLDLHGCSVRQAEDELRAFLRSAHTRQLRCVLVIHGKGGFAGEGKIKKTMPEWLGGMPDMVLTHTLAKPQHGGHGASYILLRRKRVTL